MLSFLFHYNAYCAWFKLSFNNFLFPLQVCFSKCICCVTSFICYQINFSKFYFLCIIMMKTIKLIVVMDDLVFWIKDVAFQMRCSKGPPIVKWLSYSKFGWKNVQWPINNVFSLYPREKMKKTFSSCWKIFSLFVFGSIEFFLVAKHFPTTFGGGGFLGGCYMIFHQTIILGHAWKNTQFFFPFYSKI